MPAGRRPLKAPAAVSVRIPADLRSRLEALEPAGKHSPCPFNEAQKAAIMEFWPTKNHRALAKELGTCPTTALRWYRIWTKAGS